MIDAVADLVRQPQFVPGLLAGGLAALVVAGVSRRAPGRLPLPVGAIAVAAATVVGVTYTGMATGAFGAGLASVAVGWWLGRRGTSTAVNRSRRMATVVLLAAGFGLVTLDAITLDASGRLALAVAGILSAVLLTMFDRTSRHATAGPALLLLTICGVYATIPDTEGARLMAAAALPVAALGWPLRKATLGGATVVWVALFTWVVGAGGHTRPGSVVGAFACLGLLAVDPIARLVGGGSLLDRLPRSLPGTVLLLTSHLTIVIVAARVAGLQPSVAGAAAVAVPLLVGVVVVLAWGARRGVTPPTG